MVRYSIIILLLFLGCTAKKRRVQTQEPEVVSSPNPLFDSLSVFHSKLAPPTWGEWHFTLKEKGQTFEQYLDFEPNQITSINHKLYLAYFDSLSKKDSLILEETSKFLSLFFQCEVETQFIPVNTDTIPKKFFRRSRYGKTQVLSDFYMKEVLSKRIPEDAWGVIGYTTKDIYPDPRWNYVFGKASYKNKVAVWSSKRLSPGNKIHNEAELIRNIKTATHESGHMLSMKHCIRNNCLMNGSVDVFDTDERPAYLCNNCLRKLDWNFNVNHIERSNKLKSFWSRLKRPIYEQYYTSLKEYFETKLQPL